MLYRLSGGGAIEMIQVNHGRPPMSWNERQRVLTGLNRESSEAEVRSS